MPFCRQYCLGERKGVLKELINVYKYQAVRAAGDVLAELIVKNVAFDEDAVLVPLPTIRRHIRERGFAHIERLASRICKLSRHKRQPDKTCVTCAQVLCRANSTVQVGASAERRARQAQEAYMLKSGFDPEKHYILLDDVWTTGSSMLSAAQKLRSQGAQKIDILVIAKTV